MISRKTFIEMQGGRRALRAQNANPASLDIQMKAAWQVADSGELMLYDRFPNCSYVFSTEPIRVEAENRIDIILRICKCEDYVNPPLLELREDARFFVSPTMLTQLILVLG